MKTLIANTFKNSLDYEAYMDLCETLVSNCSTTGEITEEKINFTKLNYSRAKRLQKTIQLTEADLKLFGNLSQAQTWMVIAEPWCADGAQTVPILHKIATAAPNISLRIVLRDEHPEFMDLFLTNGSRSIPILVAFDESGELLFKWGPRSANATKLASAYKSKHGKIDSVFKEELQRWYLTDKGRSIISDITSLAELQEVY